jgi:hypothetical protein
VLPVVPSYQVFKKNMEYAVCQLTVMQAIWSQTVLFYMNTAL